MLAVAPPLDVATVTAWVVVHLNDEILAFLFDFVISSCVLKRLIERVKSPFSTQGSRRYVDAYQIDEQSRNAVEHECQACESVRPR